VDYLLFLSLFAALSAFAEVSAIYLSWYADPSTTMTIQWHDDDPATPLILSSQSIPSSSYSLEKLSIHTVSLDHLEPDTEYSFRIGEEPFKFRTAPASLAKPFRFIVGGDALGSMRLFRKMNKTVLQNDPLFAVIGGDIAYAIHSSPVQLPSTALQRWLAFLREWTNMRTPDGRLIPFLLVAGNHDIDSNEQGLFFKLFAFPEEKLYRTIDFGNYLRLILLDTGHFQPIEGAQTDWLEEALKTPFTYRFAVYHIAAYPSYYSFNASKPTQIRTHWVPLFEAHKLPAAFENHNHAYKRTHPLKNNQIDPSGVVYLGDGCWGVTPRNPNKVWYLAKGSRQNNIYKIDLSPEKARIQALDLLNSPIDEIELPPNNK
jgi:hypothetical protein